VIHGLSFKLCRHKPLVFFGSHLKDKKALVFYATNQGILFTKRKGLLFTVYTANAPLAAAAKVLTINTFNTSKKWMKPIEQMIFNSSPENSYSD
jgi:hypothetical protein